MRAIGRIAFIFAVGLALWVESRPAVRAASVQAQAGPVPVPAPTGVAAPSPAPSPSATPVFYDRFAAVDLLLGSKVANAFDPNLHEPVTQSLRGAIEFKFLKSRNYGELEYRRWKVTHPSGGYDGIANGTPCNPSGGAPPVSGNAGCVTQVGGASQVYVNAAQYNEQDLIVNSSLIGIGRSINYIATSALLRSSNYGYPTLNAGFGIGAERLPDMRKKADIFGYFFYYPELHGKYSLPDGTRVNLRYKAILWRVGADVKIPRTPIFLELGYLGDRSMVKENAPDGSTHDALTLGFGGHF